MAGVYTNQRLNLSKPGEGSRRTCQALEPDSANPTVRDFRGASRNVCHGETVTPSRNRKSGSGNPSPTARRARILSRHAVTPRNRKGEATGNTICDLTRRPRPRHNLGGVWETVPYGEPGTPPAIERAGTETRCLQRGALDLYPNHRKHRELRRW